MRPPVVRAWRLVSRHSHLMCAARCPSPTRPTRVAPLRRPAGVPAVARRRACSAVVVLDCLEIGLGGVPFLHHPVERVEQVVDLGVGGLFHPIAHDLVDLPRRLSLQQHVGIFLVQANHPIPFPSSQSPISMPILRAVPMTMRSAASTVAELRSGVFSSAISRTCARVTLPTLVRL